VLWTKPWAGQLGDTLLFHSRRLSRTKLSVGYFVYWSTERPWGDNNLTRWVLPAAAIDAVYSHFLFVLPGMQRVLYGPGDIEGFRVTYEIDANNRLVPRALVADDATHHEVQLSLQDAVDDAGRLLLYADGWSHQLGGTHARSVADAGATRHCYAGSTIQSLSPDVIDGFRLGTLGSPRRAKPAWRLSATAAVAH
jgi:hypothetical protein